MLRIFRKGIPNTRFTLGVASTGIAGGLFAICVGLDWGRLCAAGSTALFCTGLALFLSGFFTIIREVRVIQRWDDRPIEKALRSAPPDSVIRILDSWLPKLEWFCSFLEELLVERGKRFVFQILLMNPGKSGDDVDDLLAARIRLRPEDRTHAQGAIIHSVARLMRMKRRVDREWGKNYPGRELALSIRIYEFMPFGSIYHIGQDHIFAGVYMAFSSSPYEFMLEVRDHNSRLWRLFEYSFVTGWNHSRRVVGVDGGRLVLGNGA